MRIIGITGGIGAGKTEILSYIKESYNCRVIVADEVAHLVKEPGQSCYEALIFLLGNDILDKDGIILKSKMAERIFADDILRLKVNGIIHPAVKDYIREVIAEERKRDVLDFLWIEAALLIEDNYEEIVDELWYVFAKEEVRAERLKRARNYSPSKIRQIMQSQLSDEEYRRHCKVIIDNSDDLNWVKEQIDERLEGYLWEMRKNILES